MNYKKIFIALVVLFALIILYIYLKPNPGIMIPKRF